MATNRVRRPLSGEVVVCNGLIYARMLLRDKTLCVAPTTFPSKLAALEYVHLSVRGGLVLA